MSAGGSDDGGVCVPRRRDGDWLGDDPLLRPKPLKAEYLLAEQEGGVGGQGGGGGLGQVPPGDIPAGAVLEAAVTDDDRRAVPVDDLVPVEVEDHVGGVDDEGRAVRTDVRFQDVDCPRQSEEVGRLATFCQP